MKANLALSSRVFMVVVADEDELPLYIQMCK